MALTMWIVQQRVAAVVGWKWDSWAVLVVWLACYGVTVLDDRVVLSANFVQQSQ